MNRAEGIITLQEKYKTRMFAKRDQINEILPVLDNFKNEKFKYRVAEFIQWSLLQLGKKIIVNFKCFIGKL